ncbi:hypothetical protein BCR34DRAFT_647012 [Clohesyomyces aquaticus]|uniref:Uncharacterized protein n=1 Tax=Clohesyomyces aquaticus TaxID=1231657 RepID=A0A1Y1ZVC4_9PLEO|nr:hypothetical protein BCR34DRAFT_647012 [Clohesyomyces aquaticus]
MKLTLLLASALAAVTLAIPQKSDSGKAVVRQHPDSRQHAGHEVARRDPNPVPETHRSCQKCSDKFNDCFKGCPQFGPGDCGKTCEILTCYFEDCSKNCAWKACPLFGALADESPAVAARHPDTNEEASIIVVRQDNSDRHPPYECDECTNFHKKCLDDCGWFGGPACISACDVKTCRHKDCKEKCGWTRC